MMSRIGIMSKKANGFTLVELLVAVAVIAVGMVFVLSALGQCIKGMTTAQKSLTASELLTQKLWEIDLEHIENNGSIEGEWSGAFSEPNEGFRWSQVVAELEGDFGVSTPFVQEALNEETVFVYWKQGRMKRDVRVSRYVPKKEVEDEDELP